MTNNSIYENLHFTQMISTINADSYPHSFPLHWHKYVEIAALPEDANISRPPTLHINQTAYHMNPGDVLLIWPGEVHEIVENADSQLMGLQFTSTIFNELPDFAPFVNHFRTFHHIRQLDTPELAQNMLVHIQHMFAVQRSQQTFSGVETLICLYEMFMDFGNYIKNTTPKDTQQSSPEIGKTAEKINIACSYIIDNCEHDLTLESAADYVGFSACYFSRMFKRITNHNFIEYLTLQRIKRAQLLLSDFDVPITEISYQAGFKSISTFNRVFRQYRGCSPSEYRKYYIK
ncbi:MAG: helix-turn-helix transcriptional regulator [Lachnospiraceae bacterium]|nr:helix-turn-helix transcriptional regulator [Lachnospiraceae bacterium]